MTVTSSPTLETTWKPVSWARFGTDQAFPGGSFSQTCPGQLRPDFCQCGASACLFQLCGAAGLTQPAHQVGCRGRRSARLLHLTNDLVCCHRRDPGTTCLQRGTIGRRDGDLLRLGEADLRDIPSRWQCSEGQNIGRQSHFPFHDAGARDARDGKARIRRDAGRDARRLGQPEVVERRLQIAVVDQRDPHGGVGGYRLPQQILYLLSCPLSLLG